ncbi:DAK2 domain-containing protein [Jatrophihabitans sp.]|uniref:DAK2 domain-containing protein n=1 Tax=Jatrophihabitans sp. TaxID=1932789 RepID=UPI002C17DC76|nr:DAK2 domain-containing protein [Jatrophihabitans sp.]
MLTLLDASAVRRWCTAAVDELEARRGEIDDLNVFPIPDGDTGTNLVLTLRGAADAVATDRSPTAGGVLAAMAKGALMNARGNSGVIVSQILAGLAEACQGAVEADGRQLAAGLRLASEAAYAAVAEPVEGTMLTVARGGADAAAQLGESPELSAVAAAAAAGAAAALADTPEQLAVLAEAGVVDAGGCGLVVLLEALATVVTGQGGRHAPARLPVRNRQALEAVREAGSPEFGYEVQYLLHAPETALGPLKQVLGELGDSLVVVGGGDGLFNVHVHVNDVGAAIEAGIEAGRPHRITVVRFADHLSDGAAAHPAEPGQTGTALVAVAPGDGLADLFRSEGVAVVDGGPGGRGPLTADVLAEILATAAGQVILLPNSSAVREVAEAAATRARQRGVTVAVVPTKSPVQGLAAVAVHDDSRRFEDNVIALAEAAAATRFAEVTIAVRDSITYAGRCSAGDVLGLIDGEVVEIGLDVAKVGISLVRRLVAAGGELVTVLSGSDRGASAAAQAVHSYLRSRHPLVEVNVFVGGQPKYPLLIGVE